MVVTVCEYLGIPVIFETDDNYFDLLPSNPAFLAVADQALFKRYYKLMESGEKEKAQELMPELLESRKKGLEEYKQLLRIVDYVTVSTEELAQTIYPYNKNVVVFENNIERVFPWRDNSNVMGCISRTEDGKTEIEVPETLDLYTIPNFQQTDKMFRKIPRIGYTGTPSHIGEDFNTIKDSLNAWHSRNAMSNNHFLIALGTPYFYDVIEDKMAAFKIRAQNNYEKYLFNLRNIDVCLAPLFPCIFNQSKSDLKMLECASWRGSTGILPKFITYERHWKHEETCLLYQNSSEFEDCLDRIVKDEPLRKRLGENAFTYVSENRLESQHAEKRYDFYKAVIAGKKVLSTFKPNKVEVLC